MTAADFLGAAFALALLCVVVALVINGVRNLLHAWTIARQTRVLARQTDLSKRITALEKNRYDVGSVRVRLALLEVKVEGQSRVTDALVKTQKSTDRLTNMLITDLRNVIEPDEIPTSSGSVTHTSPPAPSRDSEGKA